MTAGPRWWLGTVHRDGPARSNTVLYGPDGMGRYTSFDGERRVRSLPSEVSDLRPAMVVEEPDEAQIRAIVDAHMAEIEAVDVPQREDEDDEVMRLAHVLRASLTNFTTVPLWRAERAVRAVLAAQREARRG